ncbi:hypothetical protein NQD34_013101, partial [Periophthalmus magnuspinnatus]
ETLRFVQILQKKELSSHLALALDEVGHFVIFTATSDKLTCMAMALNDTCIPGHNSTSTCQTSGSHTGLAAGLSVFFILLVLGIVAAIFSYRQFEKLRRVMSFGSRRRIEKEREVCGEAPQTVRENHKYCSQPEPRGQAVNTPIYENVTRASTGPRVKAPGRPAPQPEDDDVYLQCDAIYSNDPACNPSDDHQEDDTYIIPDS